MHFKIPSPTPTRKGKITLYHQFAAFHRQIYGNFNQKDSDENPGNN